MKKNIAVIREQIKLQKLSYLQLKELEWANVYHDSIRGHEAIEKLPLNIGRWAGNYAFFYILNRILIDFKPKQILEFGLGESTKFISAFCDDKLTDTKHTIIEHNSDWKSIFLEKFSLSPNSEIKLFPIVEQQFNSKTYNSYNNITSEISTPFDLYIIDGPIGTSNYSRFDIVNLAAKFSKDSEFIILLDDYERNGEKETGEELLHTLNRLGINFTFKEFQGNKSVLVIATEKYKYITSV
jgi:hypothetical protein